MDQLLQIADISGLYKTMPQPAPKSAQLGGSNEGEDFQTVLDSAMGLIRDTNTLQNKAQMEEIKFELGYAQNSHDLFVAEQKASIALQYTTAVRDRFLEAYNSIMQTQI